ncbi:P-loop containing nucleoside triphosphate hydrolase protein [Pelagophyceae sp. CCMP2097]|nr:P-loop containing nucleoside triphosphate hydrolase protein [Pelagophyceae sp. CCMP2097]
MKMKKFQCLSAGPPRDATRDAPRPRNAALSQSAPRQKEAPRRRETADGGLVDVVRATFMPGVLTTKPSAVRQPFQGLAKPSLSKKTLGPRSFAGIGVVSKFLSGQDFSTKLVAPEAVALVWDSDEASSVASDAPEEEVQPRIKPHERLVLYEPNAAEAAKGFQVMEVPALVCQFLRPHQREGVQFVFECVYGLRGNGGCGAILADDMGLGKTLQSIALLYTLLKCEGAGGEPVAKRVVVVCPCSLVQNWHDEFEKWVNVRALGRAERVECMALSETSRKTVEAMVEQFLSHNSFYDIIVLSYETFRTVAPRFARSKRGCDLVICDEAHRLKNAEAQTSKALASLQTRRRVLLSGTPMQNDLGEFFAMRVSNVEYFDHFELFELLNF